MNINLAGTTKKGQSIGYGLNKRKKSNVFDEGEDDDDSDQGAPEEEESKASARDAANREIAAEQEALRKRALKAMASNAYDFDGSYEVVQAEKEKETAKAPEEKTSRYVQDLMKQSEKRAIERETAHERKVAREQQEEEAQADFQGKEKFITKAYKRKLEERKKLAAEDKKQEKIDEEQDVTKRTGGAAMANFYGNWNKNVALGGRDKLGVNNSSNKDIAANQGKMEALRAGPGFGGGLQLAGPGGDTNENVAVAPTCTQNGDPNGASPKMKELALDPASQNRAMRKAREEKLDQARMRYFRRNGMPVAGVR